MSEMKISEIDQNYENWPKLCSQEIDQNNKKWPKNENFRKRSEFKVLISKVYDSVQ